MKNPITGKEMILVKEIQFIKIRNIFFDVILQYYKSDDSEERFTTTELDELNLKQIYKLKKI